MDFLWNMLFGGQDTIGLGINIFIVLLFAIAVGDILRGRAAIARERLSVRRAKTALARHRQEDQPLAKSSGTELLEVLGTGRDSLLGQRISRMTELRQAGMASRDVLQQLTSEKVASYGALSRQIGATLTLLGLLGTVFGLSLALVNIGDASANIKGVDDLEKLSRALAGTMGGMKTAFGCTLAGLLSAVTLSFLNHVLRRTQSLASSEMEEFLLCELLPALSEYDSDADTATKSFAEVLSNASAHLEALSKNVNQAATSFEGATAEFRTVLSQVSTAVSASSQELTQAAESNREVRNFIVRYSDEYKAFLSSSAETFRRALDSAAAAMAKNNAAELSGMLQKHVENLDRVANNHQGLMHKHVENLDKVVDNHQGVLRKHLESLDKVVGNHQGVMQVVSDMVLDVQLNGRARSVPVNGGAA